MLITIAMSIVRPLQFRGGGNLPPPTPPPARTSRFTRHFNVKFK